MSFHAVCDICGKDSNLGKAVFNQDPIQVEVENYKLEKYRVFVNVNIQHEEDYQFLKGIKEKTDKELQKLSERDDLELNTPEPHICVACQKALAKKVLEEGFVDPDKVYTPKMKVHLHHFTTPSIMQSHGISGPFVGYNELLNELPDDSIFDDLEWEDEDFDEEELYDEEDFDEDSE